MKQFWQKYLDYFLIGILGLLPIVIIIQIVAYVERILRNFLVSIYGRYESVAVTIALFVAATGFLIYFGYLLRQEKAHFLYYMEALLERVPFLGSVYRVTKKVFAIFRGDDKVKLREVVYVEYPKDGVWVPAYVTNRVGENYIVYVPTSPNPTSGFTIILHKSKVIHSVMDIEQASSFVISIGVDLSAPEEAASLPRRSPDADQSVS